MRIYQVDSFTDRPFTGNPAAVVLADGPLEEAWMTAVAAEMNLSETAFVHPLGDGTHRLRWFTPTVEVDLCGHATLAAAHVMRETGAVPGSETIRFATNSGELRAVVGEGGVELDFPATPPAVATAPDGLDAALGGVPATWVGVSVFDWIVELADERAVRALVPDLDALAALGRRGVVVTARADAAAGYDFVSRFFAPNVGVAEDPVTGSTHCALAPLWTIRLGREELRGYQASPRGGIVGVRTREERVLLRGEAVTVFTAELATIARPG